ncbi:hypothetical protein D9A33_18425 [Vibrio cholerae]|nr:hypothetical protein [Vibrio cholerae]
MIKMTHKIISGIKAGLHVSIIRDGAWVLVVDTDGVEHRVRKKQLIECREHIVECDAATSYLTFDIQDDPLDDHSVTRELAEYDEVTQEIEQNPKSMSDAFQPRRTQYKTTDGCGDELQFFLKGFSPSDVAAIAEYLLGIPRGELLARYSHLNNGQIRMNSGNRIRSLINKGLLTISDVRAAVERFCIKGE